MEFKEQNLKGGEKIISARELFNEKTETQIDIMEKHTSGLKSELEKEKKEEDLELLEELNRYAIRAGFNKILIAPAREMDAADGFAYRLGVPPRQEMEISILSHNNDNYILIPQRNLSILKEIKGFAPEFFDEALKHVFGDKEKNIPGYFQEGLRGGASEIYKDKIETVGDKIEAAGQGDFKKAVELHKKGMELNEEQQVFAERQRMQKYSKTRDEAIDAIIFPQLFFGFLASGFKNFLKAETIKPNSDKAELIRKQNIGPYPDLQDEAFFNDALKKYEDIRKQLEKRDLEKRHNGYKKIIEEAK